MFKRVFWFGSGVASGVAGTTYVRRKVRQQVERFTPEGMKKQAVERSTEKVEQIRNDVTSYLRQGRSLLAGLGRSKTADTSTQHRRDEIRSAPDQRRVPPG